MEREINYKIEFNLDSFLEILEKDNLYKLRPNFLLFCF